MTRTITGLFDTRAEADAVVDHLRMHDGVDRDRITVHGAAGSTAPDTGDRGFWASLRDLFIADEDRYAYSEGIRRGGFVVSAEVDEGLVDHAMDVFEQHGAVDLDSREAEWRSAGWSGYAPGPTSAGIIADEAEADVPMNTSAAVGAGTMAGTSVPAVDTEHPVTGPGSGMSTAAGDTTPMRDTAAASGRVTGEERIPVVEEQLRVGKREMDRGRVRVRSYVVETPVNETITLRDERLEVERRPVDLPVSAADDAFRERTIEAVEHSEEAVVSKEARVREEVVIRKDAGERTETVSDTVRRTEVEVDDDRTAKSGTTPDRPAGT
jgi:uncharacterized protein (TIGR02271 family)